ncbi:DUF1707 SHOCT-like domain-containing protein [Micromonospora sp. DT201]|uniref:DUF1707 SHOCT-like domain-containing protein n=1 Tax=Micromonospora sp. DT201 TaxID=3393442 RepID=UPI003CF4AB17
MSSVAVGWISPNASCPVCGASVYFYANQHGSRVFFDDLGPPWPKHPCTDDPTRNVTTAGGRQAPSLRDFSVMQRPSESRDRRWKPYTVRGITIEDGRPRITLQPLSGSGRARHWIASKPMPLQADDLVFVQAQQMSYFDTDVWQPAVVEDARRAVETARKLITTRDKQHVLATLAAQVAAGEMTLDEMADASVAVQAARTRGEIADALKIRVTDLKVAPPRPGDLWMLAIAFVLMVVATSAAEGGRSFLMMLPGLLLMATAVYRLNPDVERGTRVFLAVLMAMVAICPAGVLGGAIQVEILGH